MSKWLINKKCILQKIVSKCNANEFKLDGKMGLCVLALLFKCKVRKEIKYSVNSRGRLLTIHQLVCLICVLNTGSYPKVRPDGVYKSLMSRFLIPHLLQYKSWKLLDHCRVVNAGLIAVLNHR